MNRQEIEEAMFELGFVPDRWIDSMAFIQDLPLFHHKALDVYATQGDCFAMSRMHERGIVCFFVRRNGCQAHVPINQAILDDKELITDELNNIKDELNKALRNV